MQIIFKEKNNKLFGSTSIIGIGKRQPNLIYGEQAKKLREQANLSEVELANEFKENVKTIFEIEEQKKMLNEKMFKKIKLLSHLHFLKLIFLIITDHMIQLNLFTPIPSIVLLVVPLLLYQI